MSEVLSVTTDFEDLAQLSEGFADRVGQDTLILYGPCEYEDGERIDFAILFADGTPAIEGSGAVRATFDGGEERFEESRFDVVLEGLELDGRFQVIFERLMMIRDAQSDPPPAAGDDQAEYADADAAEADDLEEAVAAHAEDLEDAYEAVEADEVEEVDDAEEVAEAAAEEFQEADDAHAYAEGDDHTWDASDDVEEVAEEMAAAADAGFEVDIDAGEAPMENGAGGAVQHFAAPVQVIEPSDPAIALGEELPPKWPAPEMPPMPVFKMGAVSDGLSRPSIDASWEHDSGRSFAPRPAGQDFHYTDGLPVPSRPPVPGPVQAMGSEALQQRNLPSDIPIDSDDVVEVSMLPPSDGQNDADNHAPADAVAEEQDVSFVASSADDGT